MLNRRAGVLQLLAGVVLLAGAGCSDSTEPEGFGTVIGRVTAANGITPVPSVSVYLEYAGPSSAILTDSRGDYKFENVPVGTHIIRADKGNFHATDTIVVRGGGWTNLSPAVRLTAVGELAYVDGSYDSIEDLIKNLGYTAKKLELSELTSQATLSQYRMIFLNCGANVPESAATALLEWVSNGGTLYASDWELDVVQAMFPEDILTVSSAPSQNITGTITDGGLEQFVGKPSVLIAYDLSAWKTLSQVSNTPSVLVRGNIATDQDGTQNQPLAIAFSYGTGHVVYTTFHNEAGVTIDQLAVLRYFIYY